VKAFPIGIGDNSWREVDISRLAESYDAEFDTNREISNESVQCPLNGGPTVVQTHGVGPVKNQNVTAGSWNNIIEDLFNEKQFLLFSINCFFKLSRQVFFVQGKIPNRQLAKI